MYAGKPFISQKVNRVNILCSSADTAFRMATLILF